jgi:hypothetical protein
MRRYTVLLLTVLVAVPGQAAPDRQASQPAEEEITQTYTLATLSLHQAQRLHGREACFRVRLTNDGDLVGKFDWYECDGDDDTRLYTVMFPAGQAVDDEMLVEGVLLVIHHRGWVAAAGQRVEGCTEFRLVQARRVSR